MLAHGIDLKLGWLLVSHSLTLCSLLRACISYRQVKFWVESFVGGLVSLSLTGGPTWLQEVASSGSISTVLGVLDKVT